MDITPHIAQDAKVVQRYGPGRFTISNETYRGAVLVCQSEVQPWTDRAMDAWSDEDLAPVFAIAPPLEILLIGTGATMQRVPSRLRAALRDKGVGCDGMDTGAACRTYNILMAEGRRVAAVLIAVD